MKRTRVLMGLVVAGMAGGVMAALPEQVLRDSQSQQQQIRGQTQAVAAQVDAIIADFEENDIAAGDDIKTLKGISAVLSQLSDQQMQQVIKLLQQARGTTDETQVLQNVTGAYNGQKEIVAQLGQILADYQRRQAVFGLSLRFERLADRQDANLKGAIVLGRVALGKSLSEYGPAQKASLDVQQAEQTQLSEEVARALSDLKLMADGVDGNGDPRLQQAAAQAEQGRLASISAGAADDLSEANPLRAASGEKIARDQLRQLARLVSPPQDALSQLRQGLEEINQIVDQQQQLAADTGSLPRPKGPMTAQEQKQGELVDRTDSTRRDITDLAPAAAGKLQDAQDQMQAARASLNGQNRDPATQKELSAVTSLQEAREEIQKQMDEASALQQQPPQDKLAQATQLLDQVKDASQRQQNLQQQATTQPANSDLTQMQQQLRDQTRDLQARSAGLQQVAQPLANAAQHMDQAQQAMSKANTADEAQQQQQQAQQQLSQAQDQLQQQVNQLQTQQKNLEQMQQADDHLAKAIEDQEQVSQGTQHAADQQAAPPDLAAQQAQAADQAQQAQQQLPSDDQDAAPALEQAHQQMAQAQQNLAKPDPAAARPLQDQAMQNLQKAKEKLDQNIADAHQALGDQPNPAPTLDAIAQQLQQAQDQVQQAQQNLAGADADQARSNANLQEAQTHLEQAASLSTKASAQDQGTLAAAAQDALKDAQGQLNQAAQNAAQKQSGKAQQNAQQAQQSLAKAQAAVQLAMNGVPDQPILPPQSQPRQQTDAKQASDSGSGNADGPRGMAQGNSQFLGLPARDRQAIQQSQSEKYPQEYGPMIEQYYRNLADEKQ